MAGGDCEVPSHQMLDFQMPGYCLQCCYRLVHINATHVVVLFVLVLQDELQ